MGKLTPEQKVARDALHLHIAHCEICSGNGAGCADGQILEVICIANLDFDPYDQESPN